MSIEVELRLADVDAYLLAAHGGFRSLTAEESDILWEYGAQIEAYVVDRWPVDTGTSRDSFSFTVNGQPGNIGIEFTNPMFYAEYVHEAGTPADPPLYEVLFPEARDLYRASLVADLKSAISQTEAEIARASDQRGRRGATLRAYQSPITLRRAVA